jgi:FkbM family methyltransferase
MRGPAWLTNESAVAGPRTLLPFGENGSLRWQGWSTGLSLPSLTNCWDWTQLDRTKDFDYGLGSVLRVSVHAAVRWASLNPLAELVCMLNQLLERLKFGLKRFVEGNVYFQYYAFRLAYYCKFLLPHDSDYNGVTQLAFQGPQSGGILDVGANLGLSALSFRKLLPKVRIFSIEPNLVHADWLARIKRKDQNFDYAMVGAGETKETLTLHVPYFGNIPLHTMASLNLDDLKDSCHAVYGDKDRSIHIKTFSATILPIDELQLSPELVKVDAEGFELAIVKGGWETIRRARPYLLLENNPKSFASVYELMKPLGYKRYYWDDWRKAFTAAEMSTRNVYLLPEEKAA